MKRSELKRTQPMPKGNGLRRSRPKMTAARKAAKGKPCMVRLPGCDGGGETTVLAHYRLTGYCGTGMKPPDEMGAWACFGCHSCIDFRSPTPCGYTKEMVRLAHCEGVLRTMMERTDDAS